MLERLLRKLPCIPWLNSFIWSVAIYHKHCTLTSPVRAFKIHKWMNTCLNFFFYLFPILIITSNSLFSFFFVIYCRKLFFLWCRCVPLDIQFWMMAFYTYIYDPLICCYTSYSLWIFLMPYVMGFIISLPISLHIPHWWRIKFFSLKNFWRIFSGKLLIIFR